MYLLSLGPAGSCGGSYQPTERQPLYWVTITQVTLGWNLAGVCGVYIWRVG